ncbi:MAG: copper resistance protein [Nocardioidaceae bacterium]|jgi:methionine-rich copper-binding protein CopC|nr:copper resistance protein [Nocardioidaceae bacterium]
MAVLIAMLWTIPASAHAVLVGTTPKDGASFASAPHRITLTFNENIGTPAFIAVQSPDGKKVTTSKATAIDHRITATVADVGKRGRYAVSYRVVSADGHPVEGTFHYSVTTGKIVKQVSTPSSSTFVHRHSGHLFWGILAAAVAIALLLAPLRRRSDSHDA